ncbi:hypothetical protein GCM10023195_15430 [Actinoallomurus liliacearum]|uniref:Uncharacterized protein n=1 Tax=Actinoallomurus liliacearum TaxID=1080073 RepID=A0ABP8TFZ3_9ACTN
MTTDHRTSTRVTSRVRVRGVVPVGAAVAVLKESHLFRLRSHPVRDTLLSFRRGE